MGSEGLGGEEGEFWVSRFGFVLSSSLLGSSSLVSEGNFYLLLLRLTSSLARSVSSHTRLLDLNTLNVDSNNGGDGGSADSGTALGGLGGIVPGASGATGW